MADTAEVIENKAPENNIAVDQTNPFETQEIGQQQVTSPAEVEKKDEVAETKEPIVEKKEEPVVAAKEEVKTETKEPTTAEIKFANDASKKYFELITNGEEDKLYDFLHEQRTLSTADKLSPEAQIKLNLQYQNPEFSQEEIDGLFNDTFERPEKPEQDEDELDEDFKQREIKWEKKNTAFDNKISREAKSALKQLNAKKSELILPNIPQKEQANVTVEPTAEEIAAQQKQYDAYLQSIEKGVSEVIGFSTSFKEGNLEIPISLPIPDEEKAEFKTELQKFNLEEHFKERWLNQDGTWKGKEFAEDVYWIKNRDKIMQKLVTQAANQRLEQHLKEQKNIDFSGGRQQTAATSSIPERDKAALHFLEAR